VYSSNPLNVINKLQPCYILKLYHEPKSEHEAKRSVPRGQAKDYTDGGTGRISRTPPAQPATGGSNLKHSTPTPPLARRAPSSK